MNKFKSFDEQKINDLSSINGGKIKTNNDLTSTTTAWSCENDSWYLFKKNNPTNTKPDGSQNINTNGDWVDGHIYCG